MEGKFKFKLEVCVYERERERERGVMFWGISTVDYKTEDKFWFD